MCMCVMNLVVLREALESGNIMHMSLYSFLDSTDSGNERD